MNFIQGTYPCLLTIALGVWLMETERFLRWHCTLWQYCPLVATRGWPLRSLFRGPAFGRYTVPESRQFHRHSCWDWWCTCNIHRFHIVCTQTRGLNHVLSSLQSFSLHVTTNMRIIHHDTYFQLLAISVYNNGALLSDSVALLFWFRTLRRK